MLKLYTQYRVWRDSDEGATAVEYGLMVALIAVAILGVVSALGTSLKDMFSSVGGQIHAYTPPAGG